MLKCMQLVKMEQNMTDTLDSQMYENQLGNSNNKTAWQQPGWSDLGVITTLGGELNNNGESATSSTGMWT